MAKEASGGYSWVPRNSLHPAQASAIMERRRPRSRDSYLNVWDIPPGACCLGPDFVGRGLGRTLSDQPPNRHAPRQKTAASQPLLVIARAHIDCQHRVTVTQSCCVVLICEPDCWGGQCCWALFARQAARSRHTMPCGSARSARRFGTARTGVHVAGCCMLTAKGNRPLRRQAARLRRLTRLCTAGKWAEPRSIRED